MLADEDSFKKVSPKFEKRQNQLTIPVLGHYIAESGIGFTKTMTNHCGMKCILGCEKACDSYIEKDNECTLFSLAKSDFSKQPTNYLLPRRDVDLSFMSLSKLYSDDDKLGKIGKEYLDSLGADLKECDGDGIIIDIEKELKKEKVLTIKRLTKAKSGCTFMFVNLKDDDKLVTMTLKKGFKV